LALLFLTGLLHRPTSAALRERARVFALVGLFALGLIAVQLLPEWAARSYIHKGANPELEGSQTVAHLLTNYLIGDPAYYDYASLENLPYVQEYYNYIGAMPFALLIFLIPAARRRRWVSAAFGVYFAFLLAWGAARFTFLRRVFSAIPFLYRFQFPARALRVGAFALILLAGLGLEELWLRCRALRPWPSRFRLGRIARALLMAGVLALAGHSVLHLYRVNRPLLRLEPLSAEMDEALAWLASHDTSEYAVANAVDPQRQAGTYAHYRHHLRSLNVTLGWTVADVGDGIAPDAVRAAPKYVVVPAGVPFIAPGGVTPRLVKRIRHLEIWRIPDVLPFAFTVPFDRVQEAGASLSAAAQVTERTVSRPSPNEIEVLVVNAGRDDVLVVLESWFPGWRVSVDGRPGPPLKVDRFLGVRLSAGTHQVTFRYAPLAFKAGLVVSLGTACALVAYALSADRWLLGRAVGPSARPRDEDRTPGE